MNRTSADLQFAAEQNSSPRMSARIRQCDHQLQRPTSSPVASLVLNDSSQLTSDSQHLGIYSSPVASLVLNDSSQLTSDSQHLGIYSIPVASLVLTDSSQLTSDSQHLAVELNTTSALANYATEAGYSL
uniref:Uncharacterized protein n=1 Tax=Timema douglasi TaxID=61478 RepID=A0A7R8ZDF9_TIMDO|nr:unnamed protein product [Timema douglasi]